MAKGGVRPGAGRKKGSQNKATQKRADVAIKALESGITPLEFLLDVMRKPIPPRADPKLRAILMEQRFEAAKAAAPYVHPRLASIEHGGEIVQRHVARMPAVAKDKDEWQQQYTPALPVTRQ